MDIISRFAQRAKGKGLCVVLPEGRDERIVRAARRLKDENIARPIVLGGPEQIEAACKQAGVKIEDVETINPKESGRLDVYAERYRLRRKNVEAAIARHVVAKPLFYGGMMLACGDADAMVGGAAGATASVIQAGILTVGLAPGITTPSSCFLMLVPDFGGEENRSFVFADCAVNIEPTAEQLADIALASAHTAKGILDEEPRVALLSFSTRGSGAGPSVNRVREALRIVRQRQPGLAIDGEFQADTAIIPAIAARKVKGQSSVAGKANVLVFPDLNSGNIAYKLTQHLAGAQAIGPFMQGFAKPIADLSRGATVDDIVGTVILTLGRLVSSTSLV